jgi:hypothetical protein
MTGRLQRSLQLLALTAMATAAKPAAAQQTEVTWLVFVDDLHLDFRNTGRIRDVVRRVVKQLPAEDEAVGMFSTGPSDISVMPTLDRALLDGAAKRVTGSALKPEDILAGPPARKEVRDRADAAHSRLVEMVGRVAAATTEPRLRPAIIYISNGSVAGAPPPLKMTLSSPIFALDPRPLVRGPGDPDRANWPDLWTATRNSLRTMAEASSGFLIEENESLEQVIARIAQVMRR